MEQAANTCSTPFRKSQTAIIVSQVLTIRHDFLVVNFYFVGWLDIFRPHSIWKSPKMSHLIFWILAFSTNFWPIKTDLSGNSVWPQALDFQKLAKLSIFGIFNELLSTQNVNVARFARNVEWDYFCDFQRPWKVWLRESSWLCLFNLD